jgi:tRNA-splicing ligase RtcB
MEYVEAGLATKPIKMWIGSQEFYESEGVLTQAQNIANLPMTFRHVALMADAHSGYGMPIGGVLALDGAICPAAVGYDIGCGMYAMKTNLKIEHILERRQEIGQAILRTIPVGEGKWRETLSRSHTRPDFEAGDMQQAICVSDKVTRSIDTQIGTLGGGNHFIEFGHDEDDNVWIVIHSGSRGPGWNIADYYMNKAKELNQKYWPRVPNELACFPVDSEEGTDYILAQKWSLDWALANREVMAGDIIELLGSMFGYTSIHVDDTINVHHNYATLENHFGRNVWVHRKGATRANKGEKLVIPGNMGQGTAICTGLGNHESFCSTSHGAGRRLGRSEAKRVLDLSECKARLDTLDVVLVSASQDGSVDEMPEAYKSFPEVMAAQSDLCTQDHHLRPRLVIKG